MLSIDGLEGTGARAQLQSPDLSKGPLLNRQQPPHVPQHAHKAQPPMTQTGRGGGRRLLITAGPTHEPIDAVRFIGNRSSRRPGSALATEAASRDWAVTLLMGPGGALPS